MVLVILLAVTGSSTSFIWFMNRAQAQAGARFRSALALSVAEAGVHRSLAVLESAGGRRWRPVAYSEAVSVGQRGGRFTVSLADDADGAVIVTSVGEVAGARRQLRARVYLAPTSMLAALYGAGLVQFENLPATMSVLPYAGAAVARPWVHIAADEAIWFSTTTVSINNTALPFSLGSGSADRAVGAGVVPMSSGSGPLRLLFGSDAELVIGQDRQSVDVQQLRAVGIRVEGDVLRAETPLRVPEIDRLFYQARAAANSANAGVNKAAGEAFGDRDLAHKLDSLYSSAHLELIQEHAARQRQPVRLRGVVYVIGGLSLPEGRRLLVADGTLMFERAVSIGPGASLEITHSPGTRRWPGLVTLDDGAVVLSPGALLRVHGLLYASRMLYVGEGARLDVVGAVLAGDAGLSFRNAGTSAIWYDPAILGTPGLRVPDDAPVVAWVAVWEEVP